MRGANATSVGKEPAMRKHVPALAALATSILMVSCAADPAGAREQASMSAANKDSALPFHDPAVVPLAEAIARGDTARIAALAPATDLSARGEDHRSEEHTSELQSLMRISYAVFCLKKKIQQTTLSQVHPHTMNLNPNTQSTT